MSDTADTNSHPGRVSGAAAMDADERAELQRLRTEVRELRSQPSAPARRRRFSWRTPVASLLIVLGCLLAPLSVVAVWSANQVSSTSRYVENMAPLVHDPAIQNALTDKITTQITSNLNVAGLANQAGATLSSKGLPRAGALVQTFAPQLASAVAGFVHNIVHKVVTSEAFARAWTQANTVAHAQMVKVLSGQGGGAVSVTNGRVTVNLAPFIAIVKQDLAARGFTLVNNLPTIHPTIALFSARELTKAQTAYRLINTLKWVLPLLALVLLAAGVYVARGHRRTLLWAALGLAASMVVLGAGLNIFRGIYLNSVPESVLPSNAAAALYDTLVRFLRDGLRLVFAVGLVVALAAFFTGPSITAVKTRGAFRSGLRWVRETGQGAGLRTGPVGRWTYAHRTGMRIAAVAIAAVVFVFSGQPTAALVITIVVVLLVVLGLIELIGTPPRRHATAGPPEGA